MSEGAEPLDETDLDVRELRTDIKWIRRKMEEVCKCNVDLTKDVAILKAADLPVRVNQLETGLSSHISSEDGANRVRQGISQTRLVLLAGGCSLIGGLIVLAIGKAWP